MMFGLVAALDSGKNINAANAAHTKTIRVFMERAKDAECWDWIQGQLAKNGP